jgi:hypothetical protein
VVERHLHFDETSAIHLASVSHRDHDHLELPVVYLVEDSVITDAKPPCRPPLQLLDVRWARVVLQLREASKDPSRHVIR